MSGSKGIKGPSVGELKRKIAEQADTITNLNNDMHALADMLYQEQHHNYRVPEKLTVHMYNSLIDHLTKNKPEPEFPKELPEKLAELAPLAVVKDEEIDN